MKRSQKKLRKKSDFSVEEWAKKCKPNVRICATCKLPKVAEAIRTVLNLRLARKSVASVSMIHGMLCDEMGYDLTLSALGRHVYRCERALWGKIVAQEKNTSEAGEV